MKPRVTLRKALEDPELLGSALAGPTWHAWRSLLLAPAAHQVTWMERTILKIAAKINAEK